MAVLSERTALGTGLGKSPSPASRPRGTRGFSLVEVLVVCAVAGWIAILGLPSMRQAAQMKETADAAAFISGQFRWARQRAVMTGRPVALVFEDVGPRVVWRRCEDRDHDGVSRADIAAGADSCEPSVEDLSRRFPHVIAGFNPAVPPLGGSLSPVRFGVARMAVFTPVGTATAGTLVLAGAGGTQLAVRVSGVTGRVRTVRYDRSKGVWPE